MLGAIGLDETQESAYRALVAVGAAEVSDLAHRLALPENETERALRRLERQGLAAQSSARTGRWVAAPPGVALGALLTQQRHELDQAELAAALLAAEYRAEAAEPAVHDLVEVVTGASAVAHRFHQLQLGAAEEVCALVTGKPVAVTGMDDESEERASNRGVALPGGDRARGALAARRDRRAVRRAGPRRAGADGGAGADQARRRGPQPRDGAADRAGRRAGGAGGARERAAGIPDGPLRGGVEGRAAAAARRRGPRHRRGGAGARTRPTWRSCRCCSPG